MCVVIYFYILGSRELSYIGIYGPIMTSKSRLGFLVCSLVLSGGKEGMEKEIETATSLGILSRLPGAIPD